MKIIITMSVIISANLSFASDCFVSKLARDSIRAVVLVSDQAMITDMVGGCHKGCEIWANYRNHGYSDKYFVQVDEKSCRITKLKLIRANLPIKEVK